MFGTSVIDASSPLATRGSCYGRGISKQVETPQIYVVNSASAASIGSSRGSSMLGAA
jgi:hypothetical protein